MTPEAFHERARWLAASYERTDPVRAQYVRDLAGGDVEAAYATAIAAGLDESEAVRIAGIVAGWIAA